MAQNPFFPFGMPQMDPSKMDPQFLMELSNIVRELPMTQIQRMQSISHNMMAGFDVRKEMEEFERELPPGFREKIVALAAKYNMGAPVAASSPSPVSSSAPIETSSVQAEAPSSVREARLTVLRAVAAGEMDPEEAERVLFPSEE